MDKELLARKLYVERVHALMGDNPIDEALLDAMWESKASPVDAMMSSASDGYDAPIWLPRYLNRK
ncbi:hypothetical protein [Vibrio cincinnatiensis]|uniref:hypothetical protein n=1 Tax=Vibrio cincinnatiensis TaxID=675 RepID=UPI001EDD2925|nr:hypothetical protein [Vibrio cincinnatiensis]MCG3723110.1 hypothetical protein [Vibrio cincinnatiensis]